MAGAEKFEADLVQTPNLLVLSGKKSQ